MNLRVWRETVTAEGPEPINTRRVVHTRIRGALVNLRFTELTYNNHPLIITHI